MVGHMYSMLYAIVLHLWLSTELERHHMRAKGQASYSLGHQTTDHLLTWGLIPEAQKHRHVQDTPNRHHVPTWVGPWSSPYCTRDVRLYQEYNCGLNKGVLYLPPFLVSTSTSWSPFCMIISRTVMGATSTKSWYISYSLQMMWSSWPHPQRACRDSWMLSHSSAIFNNWQSTWVKPPFLFLRRGDRDHRHIHLLGGTVFKASL